ncbi:MAG: hypothetical protein ACRBFS_24465 [Aureispira sp.]
MNSFFCEPSTWDTVNYIFDLGSMLVLLAWSIAAIILLLLGYKHLFGSMGYENGLVELEKSKAIQKALEKESKELREYMELEFQQLNEQIKKLTDKNKI